MRVTKIDAERMRDAMRALGDPFRWDIVHMLAEHGELGLGDIADVVPVGKSTVSYHVRMLREAGLVTVRKEGRHRYATLNRRELDAFVRTVSGELGRLTPFELSA